MGIRVPSLFCLTVCCLIIFSPCSNRCMTFLNSNSKCCGIIGSLLPVNSSCVHPYNSSNARLTKITFPSTSTISAAVSVKSKNVLRHPIDMLSLRSEEHTSELQSPKNLVCRLQLQKKKQP